MIPQIYYITFPPTWQRFIWSIWETFYTSEVENVADKFQRYMEGGGRQAAYFARLDI